MPVTTSAWKNFTFLIGLGWLFWGAAFFDYPDWDIGLSLLMAGCTYLSADKFILALRQATITRRPSWALLGWSAAAWVSVDGSYWLYWSLVRPEVSIRDGQWPMSLCLYLLCGLIWASLEPRQALASLRAHRAARAQARDEDSAP